MPRLNLVGLEAGVGVEERRCQVTPERITAEIPAMQFVPSGIGSLSHEGRSWVEARVERLSRLGFQAYLLRGEYNSLAKVNEVRDDLLVAASARRACL